MKLTIEGRTYTIPSTFSALTMGQFVELWKVRNANFYKRLQIVAGFDPEQLPLPIISELARRLQWMDKIEMYLASVEAANLDKQLVESKPYSSVLKVQQMLGRNNGDVVACCIGIIQEYTGEDITDQPVMEGLGLVRFFMGRCHPSLIDGRSLPIYRERRTTICLWPEWIGWLPSGILTRCLSWCR